MEENQNSQTHSIRTYARLVQELWIAFSKSPSQVRVQQLSSAEPAPCHPRCRESPTNTIPKIWYSSRIEIMQGHRLLLGNLCHADKRVATDPGLAAEELVQAAAVSSKVDHQYFGVFDSL